MRQDSYGLYLEAGTYYIVTYKDYYGGTGIYKLSASFVSSQTTFSGDDNSAVNARPIGFGPTYKGQLSLNDDYDTYKFSVAAGRNIPISFRSNMRTYTIKMYDTAGKSVWTQYQKRFLYCNVVCRDILYGSKQKERLDWDL